MIVRRLIRQFRRFILSQVRRSGSYRPSARFETMPFEAVFAGELIKHRSLAELMVAIGESRRRPGQQRLQPGLALKQRQSAKDPAAEK